MRPYSIWLPGFNVTSGGIRVMYGLYGWLLAKGQIVVPNMSLENGEFVAIYPEIVQGNPFKANHVVRYILNTPGVMTMYGVPGPKTFDKHDKLYVFSELFNSVAADDRHHLFLPICNLHLFRDQGRKRIKEAVFGGKGKIGSKHPKGAIKITADLASDQQGLADLLNECQTIYCYDPVTAMTEVARLCGCKVVIFPSTYTREEYATKYEPGMNGINWGKDEGKQVYTEQFRDHYKLMIDDFSHRLDDFIADTQI